MTEAVVVTSVEAKAAEPTSVPESSAPTAEAPKTEEAPPATVPPQAEGAQDPSPEAAPAASEVATEDTKPASETTAAETQKVPKSPSLLYRLLGPLKDKVKIPKKERKMEDTKPEPSTEEHTKTEAVLPSKAVTEEAPVPATETPAETSTEPATTTDVSNEETKESSKEKKAERKDARQSAVKVGRRLSSRVGEFFKPKKAETATPAKVDENPPTIDSPPPVEPLEHPATASSADNSGSAPAPEEPKTEAPPVVPVVAAAA